MTRMAPATYLTVADAAKRLGIHRATLYRWIERGVIDTEQIGSFTFIKESVVKRELAKRQ